MMMRSKIPSKITAAKFYSMSLESFSAVSEQVFSFFFSLLFKLDQILEIETVYLIISLRGRERDVFFPRVDRFMRFPQVLSTSFSYFTVLTATKNE